MIDFFRIFFLIFTLHQNHDPRMEYVKSELMDRFGFQASEVDSLFADPRLAIYPPDSFPKRKISWDEYRREILSEQSVQNGRDFLESHRDIFNEVETRFNINGEYLVSLLRVETNLGEKTGNYRVINVFYTRLQDEERWQWAADNLIALTLYCLLYEIDCFEIRGSHAGAIGLPQFLPTILVKYAIDADGSGFEDLFSLHDAVASAANYLVALGWHENRSSALAEYYGSSRGYPATVELYASAL